MDLRQTVRVSVAARVPCDEREAESLRTFLDRFDQLAEPFTEEADPVHVTGSAIVVGTRGVVLHKHKRLGIWLQPGGHIDAGETPWDAAMRETFEETGLTGRFSAAGPQLIHVDVHPGPRGHTHLDLRYLVNAADVDPSPPPDESPDVRWFSWDDALMTADAGLIGALRAIRATL